MMASSCKALIWVGCLFLWAPKANCLHPNYNGCGTEFGCFGTKYDSSATSCVTNGDCLSMVKFKLDAQTNQFYFLLHHNFAGTGSNSYVALGLSTDSKMGEEAVISCTNQVGSVIQYSYNFGHSNSPGLVFDNPQPVPLATKDDNGIKTCEVNLAPTVSYTPPGRSKMTLDLKATQFNLLLAHGPSSNGNLLRHTKDKSSQPVSLASTSQVSSGGSKVEWLLVFHAILMIIAWMGSACSGILVAQHFKKICNAKIAGKDSWFRLHQFLMTSVVILSTIGLILVIIEEKLEPLAWNEVVENPHPAFGLVCMSLAFLNPLLAACRPGPISENRWIFNLVHGGAGHIALGFGLLAIFYGFHYDDVAMPKSMVAVLIAFVVIYVIMHVLLTIRETCNNHNQVENEEFLESQSPSYMKPILGLLLIIIWAFAIGICIWILVAKSSAGGGSDSD